MSPMQRVAAGLLVVFATAAWPPDPSPAWATYDLLADPVGWGLVLWGVVPLVRTDPRASAPRWAAVLAAVVSVPLWVPQLRHALDAPSQWAASLPQLGFALLLARFVATVAEEHDDPRVVRRFRLLATGLVVVALLPVVVLGGAMPSLAPVTALLALVVDVALVWSLLSVHRRPWLGGPGPTTGPATGRTTRPGRTTAARPRREGDGRRQRG